MTTIKDIYENDPFTKTPNYYYDEILPVVTLAQWAILSVVIRKTIGWHKGADAISISQLEKSTPMSKNTVIRHLPGLLEGDNPLLKVVGEAEDGTRVLALNLEHKTHDPYTQPGNTPYTQAGYTPIPKLGNTKENLKESSLDPCAYDSSSIEGKDDTRAAVLLSQHEVPGGSLGSPSHSTSGRAVWLEWLDGEKIRHPKDEEEWDFLVHPGVRCWLSATDRWPSWAALSVVAEELGNHPSRDMLEKAWSLWNTYGFRPDNTAGVIDWYKELMADPGWRPAKGSAKKGGKSHAGLGDARARVYGNDYYDGEGGVM